MDWIKIKNKHILNNDWSLLEIGALVKIQALTAHLERIPTENELNSEVSHKTRIAVEHHLQQQCTSLAEVLHKVCEDVAQVMHKRCTDSERLKKWRADNENTKMKHVSVAGRLDKIREDKNREDTNTVLKHTSHFIKPTLDQLFEYCKERNNAVEPTKFFDYYESNGWKVGKNPMKDWKACIRTWEKSNYSNNKKQTNVDIGLEWLRKSKQQDNVINIDGVNL